MNRLSLSVLLTAAVLFVATGFVGTTHEVSVPDDRPSAAAWTVDQAHSNVGFSVRHLGISSVQGSFQSYDATLDFDPDDLTTLSATADIEVASVDTRNDRRDNHLRSDDFFHVEEYPTMRFESTRVQNINGDTFEIVGDLTIKDVTREVVLAATLNGVAAFQGNEVAALTAETVIDRHDYGLTWSRLTEAGGLVVGRDVTITLEIEAAREQV